MENTQQPVPPPTITADSSYFLPDGCMRRVSRQSISEEFELRDGNPIPQVVTGSARIRVCYAGVCYTDSQVANSGERRPKMPGVQDTSLFPGYEVSGIIDALCPTISSTDLKPNDRVILFLSESEDDNELGYSEFMLVKEAVQNLVRLPDTVPLEIGAMLPCGALMAYCAVQKVKPIIEERLQMDHDAIANILIVGAGGLGLWTLKLAEYYIGFSATSNQQPNSEPNVRVTVADTNIEQLMVAKEQGCYDIIHWEDSLHEEYIQMRIRNVCKGGVDAVIDFVSSSRTVNRSIRVLKEEGVMVVGGNAMYDVPIDLYSLARKRQSIFGVHRGSRQQLLELVQLLAENKVKPPVYSVHPVEDANQVFSRLNHCKIPGRAVFRVSPSDGESTVFQDRSSSSNSEEETERSISPSISKIEAISPLVQVNLPSSENFSPSNENGIPSCGVNITITCPTPSADLDQNPKLSESGAFSN